MLALERIVDLKRVLLVCSESCREVEERLQQAGCYVTKVDGGATAVYRARHEILDAAVLISTGREMDITETVLNLRDVSPSVEIIIMVGQGRAGDVASQSKLIVDAIPKVKILTIQELGRYLSSLEWQGEAMAEVARPAAPAAAQTRNRRHN